MTHRVAGNLYDKAVAEGIAIGIEKGMAKGIEKERLIKDLENKFHFLSRLIRTNITASAIVEITEIPDGFVREFSDHFTEKKLNDLLKAFNDARQLRDLEDISDFIIQAIHHFGLSVGVLANYFKRSEKEILEIVKHK